MCVFVIMCVCVCVCRIACPLLCSSLNMVVIVSGLRWPEGQPLLYLLLVMQELSHLIVNYRLTDPGAFIILRCCNKILK